MSFLPWEANVFFLGKANVGEANVREVNVIAPNIGLRRCPETMSSLIGPTLKKLIEYDMKLFPNKIKFRNFLQQVDTRTTGELLKSFSPLKRYIAYNLITDEHRLVNFFMLDQIGKLAFHAYYFN